MADESETRIHDALRQRLWRHIEALPDEQVYQVLDYIEFLSSKYARTTVGRPASGLQRFSERWEDKMRLQGVGMRAIRGAMNAAGTADRMFSGLSAAGRSLLQEIENGIKPMQQEPESEPRSLAAGGSSPPAPGPDPDTDTEIVIDADLPREAEGSGEDLPRDG